MKPKLFTNFLSPLYIVMIYMDSGKILYTLFCCDLDSDLIHLNALAKDCLSRSYFLHFMPAVENLHDIFQIALNAKKNHGP